MVRRARLIPAGPDVEVVQGVIRASAARMGAGPEIGDGTVPSPSEDGVDG
jgi:hypothetical protein